MKNLLLWGFCVAIFVQSRSEQTEDVRNLILKTINEPAPNFEPCDEDLIEKATFGDMIEIKRAGYFHWCVFIGGNDGETVIQLDSPEFDILTPKTAFNNLTGKVEMRNLPELAGNDHCRINNKKREAKRKGLSILSESDTKRMIRAELKHSDTYYNVVKYNCEHFATKLKFGVPFSSQIEAAKKILTKEQFKEAVAKMFQAVDSDHYSSEESEYEESEDEESEYEESEDEESEDGESEGEESEDEESKYEDSDYSPRKPSRKRY
ncbi:phospholipase A and acyltransferase 1-like [Bradysia coprophila]|uniref:phospholipase A and acyltransferase 1-like n=1 Tax=Bradysia coprophila TaxID=38358 RepID=UPI00187D9BFB|nr:phospholipase A and acyltransferase 1-like [Bradysia coprophila]